MRRSLAFLSERTDTLDCRSAPLKRGAGSSVRRGFREIEPWFGVAAAAFLSTSHFIWKCLFVTGQPDLHEITG